MKKINKPSIIITSLGRTGTSYFSKFFENNFKGTRSFHEPGRIDFDLSVFNTIRLYGFYGSLLKKLLGQWDISGISNARLAGKISKNEAIEQLVTQRRNFIEQFNEPYYVESSYHYYGLLDIIPDVFENFQAVYVVRDPRDWVRSCINRQWRYNWKDYQYWLGNRPTPKMLNDKKYSGRWTKMDRFEKLAWLWNAVTTYAVNSAKESKNVSIITFEKIFTDKNSHKNMTKLVEKLTDLRGQGPEATSSLDSAIKKAMKTKVNKAPTNKFPKWTDWNRKKAATIEEHCGTTMKKIGYGREEEWFKKIS